jgi:hypothetical protein
MSVKATPDDEAAIVKVLDMLEVNKCNCVRCTSQYIQLSPSLQDGAGQTEAEDSPPADLENPLPMQISTMRLQIAALEASGDAVLSCLMGVVSSTMFVS